MEAYGVKYPFLLGVNNKNSLDKKGGMVKNGRWVNVNHEDWSNPNWKQVSCKATLIDRSLGKGKFTLFESDVAAMTVYEDPVLNMVMYDMVPAKSPVFDMNQPPSQDIEKSYQIPILEITPITEDAQVPPLPRRFEPPLLNVQRFNSFILVGVGLLLFRLGNRPTFK